MYLLFIFLFYTCTAEFTEKGPLVVSKVGRIRGLRASDGDYYMFLGIPYGKIDRKNPFGPALPHPKFEGTFEAFNDSAVCPQREIFFNKSIVGTLDCLNLNIFVPKVAPTSRLPVLIFICGGAFQFGSARRYVWSPKFLVKHGIIFVTLNNRLGPYGFMCINNPKAAGNQGIKDQRLALRWIKDNIDAFGGDPNRITLSGQSAGSMAVDLHIHSAKENLFQQAILESGSVLTPFLFMNPGEKGPIQLAKYLGFDTDEANEALSFLSTVPTNDVIFAMEKTNLMFKLCVENKFDDVEPIVTEYPVNLLPTVKNISILTGLSEHEELRSVVQPDGTVIADYLNLDDLLQKYIQEFFFMNNSTYNEMKLMLKKFYFDGKENGTDSKEQIINFVSDLQGNYPAIRSIRKYVGSGNKPIYFYLFSYVGGRNYVKHKLNITSGGATHGDEIGYLFDITFLKPYMSEEDRGIIDIITALWTNFVKYGNPTPKSTKLLPLIWDPVSLELWNYLQIDKNFTLGTKLFKQRMDFLDQFYETNEKWQIGYREKKRDKV